MLLNSDRLLPWKEKTINGVNVKCDFYKPSDFQKAFTLCQSTVTDSTGVGKEEFQDAQYLQNYLSNSKAAITFYDKDNGTLIIILYDGVQHSTSKEQFTPVWQWVYIHG